MNGTRTSMDEIIAAKRAALTQRKQRTPIEAVRALASMQKRPQPILSTITEDESVLLIGQIRYTPQLDGTYDPVGLARRFMRESIDAVDLFTDDVIYDGGLNDLTLVSQAVRFPVISQDYMFDEYQIVEARAAGASAIMLNARIADAALLWTLVSATQRNRMTAIIHVDDHDQLETALTLAPHVIAIGTDRPMAVDFLCDLRSSVPRPIRVLLAHPLRTYEDAVAAAAIHPDAVLLSPQILTAPDTGGRLRALLGKKKES